MSKKMLIDASHPEETRVAVMDGNKIEDFDFEQLSRKPLRGNIYLARITRVEPSLQAAFVEYGGNRHGFLAFGEIHSDYYQIPVSDREVLRKAEALEAELEEALAAYETGEDTEPDLDEDDDGLRAAPDMPDDALSDEGDEEDDAADEGDLQRASEDQPEEEDEEEEKEEDAPEDGGSEDIGSKDGDPGDGDGGVPADYAGEAAAEEPGWHAVEEEEIAALPPREAAKAADAPGGDGDGRSDGGGEDGAVSAAEGEADPADEADEEKTAKPRRRRRRGGRGRRKPGDADAKGEDESDAPEEKAASAEALDDADADDAGDADDKPRRKRGRGKAKQDDPRAKEIAELKARYEDAKRERAKLLKNYRIQEVVKRRQIMLVQAVKEERGNKGAALTTYISLAGRYGVLMPNTARGGGVSRKITNSSDRKRLRSAMSELDIPQGMGLIIRTAGAKRTKAEIKRDYDYLSRLWETIRDDTLKSVAPCLIYEEASLIKRAIRDLYDKDIDLVTVQGEEGYREAKDFMKMLMPSHAKNVQRHKDGVPLFLKHQVERQIDEMFQPTVKLPSGGYLVIQQTEALVSVDVNSGKSTKERNVEQTALKTNLEAAKEVARQCKLRDLAGLVVIDFIDMDERKNNRAVEKALKDAMKHDRARIQLGSISDFGLLEFSRQRKRSGIVDGTTRLCPLCEGAGHVRSVEMAAMRILRSVEEEALRGKAGLITVETAMDVALYTLNAKRDWLGRIEATYGTAVEVRGDPHKNGDQYGMTTSGAPRPAQSLRQDARAELATLDDAEDASPDDAEGREPAAPESDASGEDRPKRRRSRGGRGRRGGDDEGDAGTDGSKADADDRAGAAGDASGEDGDGKPKKRRRRGRRGGRRNRAEDGSDDGEARGGEVSGDEAKDDGDGSKPDVDAPDASDAADLSEDGEAVTRSYAGTVPDDAQPAAPETPPEDEAQLEDGARAEEAVPAKEPTAGPAPQVDDASASAASEQRRDPPEDTPDGPKRGGWWQRALGR